MNNKEKLENLIELYGNDVLRIATLYMQNPSTAEDIFQDVFLKVNKYLSSFQGKSSEKTWIIKITINTCKDYLKSAWRKKVVSIENFSDTIENASFDENIIDSENASMVLNEILLLPTKYKDVLILYYYKDFSTLEISNVLNIPEATVRTRMKRAREMLKEKLKIILED